MTLKSRLAAVAVASIAIGAVATAAPAQASTPMPGIDGCYLYDYWDFGYWNSNAAGYCIMPLSSDRIFMQFDWNGNYW